MRAFWAAAVPGQSPGVGSAKGPPPSGACAVAVASVALLACAAAPPVPAEAISASESEAPVCRPPAPPPPLRLVPARDGGLTCFTPRDLALLRAHLARCSEGR